VTASASFGIPVGQYRRLQQLFESAPNLRRVWIYGSRARGDHRDLSDIDLAVDAPDLPAAGLAKLKAGLEDLNVLYRVDLVHLQDDLDVELRRRIEQDRQVFWEPSRQFAGAG